MEAMIKRIIDMDKKAREITEDAQKEKLDSEKEIAEPSAPPRNRTGSGRTPITLNSFAGWRRFSPPAGES